ncbi:MAG: hypothetical protein U9N81_12110 [Bacillota bacterium]|nr:hypothetical protein [Bacillota bacterium]
MKKAIRITNGNRIEVDAEEGNSWDSFRCPSCDKEVSFVRRSHEEWKTFFKHRPKQNEGAFKCDLYTAFESKIGKKAKRFEERLRTAITVDDDKWGMYVFFPALSIEKYNSICSIIKNSDLNFSLKLGNRSMILGGWLHPAGSGYFCGVHPSQNDYTVEADNLQIDLSTYTCGATGLEATGTFYEHPLDGGLRINPYRGVILGSRLCLVARPRRLPIPVEQWPKELEYQKHELEIEGWAMWIICMPGFESKELVQWLNHWGLSTKRPGFKMRVVSPIPLYFKEDKTPVLPNERVVLECTTSAGLEQLGFRVWCFDGKQMGRSLIDNSSEKIAVGQNNKKYYLIDNLPSGKIEIESTWIGGDLIFQIDNIDKDQVFEPSLTVEVGTEAFKFSPIFRTIIVPDPQEFSKIRIAVAPQGVRVCFYFLIKGQFVKQAGVDLNKGLIDISLFKQFSLCDGYMLDAGSFGYVSFAFAKSVEENAKWIIDCLWLARKLANASSKGFINEAQSLVPVLNKQIPDTFTTNTFAEKNSIGAIINYINTTEKGLHSENLRGLQSVKTRLSLITRRDIK